MHAMTAELSGFERRVAEIVEKELEPLLAERRARIETTAAEWPDEPGVIAVRPTARDAYPVRRRGWKRIVYAPY